MVRHVLLLATLDTKGHEAEFVRDVLRRARVAVKLVDTGALGKPSVRPDVTRATLFKAAGTTLKEVVAKGDRGHAVTMAAAGAAELARRAFANGELAGVLSLGGSAGTTIGTTAMRALPIGVPKLMVSTLGGTSQAGSYVGTSDVMMLNSVVDVLGINRISAAVLTRAAQAMAGMAKGRLPKPPRRPKPLVAATMFGVTTLCVERAKTRLEAAGCEVLVFHATGSGGRTVEQLARDGLLAGVLDVTTTELADELVGGMLSAGKERLTAAGARGIPQVVSVGALDMVNFFGPESVPERFKERKFHRHNANVTLMRTTAMENAELGVEIGTKCAAAKGPCALFLPKQGVSAIDRAGQPFDDPAARQSLYDNIEANCGTVPVHEMDCHLNDPAFADAMADQLLAFMHLRPRTSRHTS
ncbi:MAG: UPF0261 family protein [Planctomycetes bacterium]|nr:UPF0261 family protein [Planctomycetota bacterium]